MSPTGPRQALAEGKCCSHTQQPEMGTWQKLRRAHTKAAGQRLQLHAPSISGDKQEKKGGNLTTTSESDLKEI